MHLRLHEKCVETCFLRPFVFAAWGPVRYNTCRVTVYHEQRHNGVVPALFDNYPTSDIFHQRDLIIVCQKKNLYSFINRPFRDLKFVKMYKCD